MSCHPATDELIDPNDGEAGEQRGEGVGVTIPREQCGYGDGEYEKHLSNICNQSFSGKKTANRDKRLRQRLTTPTIVSSFIGSL